MISFAQGNVTFSNLQKHTDIVCRSLNLVENQCETDQVPQKRILAHSQTDLTPVYVLVLSDTTYKAIFSLYNAASTGFQFFISLTLIYCF